MYYIEYIVFVIINLTVNKHRLGEMNMSFQEKKIIVSLCTTVLIFILYTINVFQTYQDRSLDPTETFKFWAAAILILIPIAIVAKLIIHIIFSIINTIATKEKEPKFADELDKLIGLKALRNSHFVFVLGFLLSISSLVLDMSPSVMFIILFFSGFLSEVAGNVTQLYMYRRGV